MLPIFPLPPPEEEKITVAEVIPDPPMVDSAPILTIESFRGVTAETCREVLTALETVISHAHALPRETDLAARLQDMRTELRTVLSIREHYADYSFHPTLTSIASELATSMYNFCDLPLPTSPPTVRVGSSEEFLRVHGTQCRMYYDGGQQTIVVHTDHMRSDGEFPPAFYEGLGEELGHFLRAEIRKDVHLPHRIPEGTPGWVNSWLVEEFYGYMGRRVLQESLRGTALESVCFPSGACETGAYLEALRHIRKELRNWLNRSLLFPSFRRERRARRKSFLTHARGYSFAQMIDMNRITNWHAFFALQESDVRRRFFREDQDYRNI